MKIIWFRDTVDYKFPLFTIINPKLLISRFWNFIYSKVIVGHSLELIPALVIPVNVTYEYDTV